MGLLVKIITIFSSSALIIVLIATVSIYTTRRTKNQSSSTVHPPNTTMGSIIDTDTNATMSNAIDSTIETVITSVALVTTENMGRNASTSIRSSTITSATSRMLLSISNSEFTRMRSSTSISTISRTLMGITSSALHNIGGATSAMTTPDTMTIANTSPSTQIVRGGSTATSRLTSANTIFNMTRGGGASTASISMTTPNSPVCTVDFQLMNSYTYRQYTGMLIITKGYFNNDNYVDLAVTNSVARSVGILLGNGNGTFSAETMFSTGNNTNPIGLTTGDFNNDRQMDVAVTSSESNSIIVLLGNGDGMLTAQVPIPTGNTSSPRGIVTGYINLDNFLDIAVASFQTNEIGIFMGNGDGTFQSKRTISTGNNSQPISIAAGDFNHDNYTDLAVVNMRANNVGIFLGIGNGSFQSQLTFPTGRVPMWINVANFNGDTRLDVAVLNRDDDNIGILLGMGDGSFSGQTTYAVGDSSDTWAFTIGDVNQDQRWDIIVPNRLEDSISILFGRGDGTFAAQKRVSTGTESWPYSVVVADFNRDNRSDIAVVSSGTDSVDILMSTC